RSMSGNQPIDPRICERRVETHAVELDGVLRIKAAVQFPLNNDRQFAPIDKESKQSRIDSRIESDRSKFGLSDSVPTFVFDGNLCSWLRGQCGLQVDFLGRGASGHGLHLDRSSQIGLRLAKPAQHRLYCSAQLRWLSRLPR